MNSLLIIKKINNVYIFKVLAIKHVCKTDRIKIHIVLINKYKKICQVKKGCTVEVRLGLLPSQPLYLEANSAIRNKSLRFYLSPHH